MKPKNVDEYIKSAPEGVQEKLHTLRKIIKEECPEAEEKLSYGMPYFGYKGRLVYFAFAKNHVGLYIPPPTIKEHAIELKNYTTATATVQFPLDKDLPTSLIRKLMKDRIKRNNEKKK